MKIKFVKIVQVNVQLAVALLEPVPSVRLSTILMLKINVSDAMILLAKNAITMAIV